MFKVIDYERYELPERLQNYKDADKITLSFINNEVQSDLCASCRLCCNSDCTDSKCKLVLPHVAHKLSMMELRTNFHMGRTKNFGYLLPRKDCKSLSPTGCLLTDKPLKPITCRLYPYYITENELSVDPNCPIVEMLSLNKIYKVGKLVANYISSLDPSMLLGLTITDVPQYIRLGLYFEQY